MVKLSERIRSRGHWELAIHPTVFQADLVTLRDLVPTIQRCSVDFRGWDFPHIESSQAIDLLQDSIAHASRWEHHAEIWRFFQSGQFVCLKALDQDWRDESTLWRAPENWIPGRELGIFNALNTLYEFFSFASRLARTTAGNEQMTIQIKFGNLAGRFLTTDSSRRSSIFPGKSARQADFQIPIPPVSRELLIADPKSFAARAAAEVFDRFDRNFSEDQLLDWLGDLRH